MQRYKFCNEDVDGLMVELFHNDERVRSREFKTAAALDQLEPLSLAQAHLILHAFFVEPETGLSEKISMVAEVLLAGPDLENDYPVPEVLEAKITDVQAVFDQFTNVD